MKKNYKYDANVPKMDVHDTAFRHEEYVNMLNMYSNLDYEELIKMFQLKINRISMGGILLGLALFLLGMFMGALFGTY